MRTLRPSAVAFAILCVVFLLGTLTSAHHSRAGYDSAAGKLVTNNGVVSNVTTTIRVPRFSNARSCCCNCSRCRRQGSQPRCR